jgi:hypothetical protein
MHLIKSIFVSLHSFCKSIRGEYFLSIDAERKKDYGDTQHENKQIISKTTVFLKRAKTANQRRKHS